MERENVNYEAIEARNQLRGCEEEARALKLRIMYWEEKLAKATENDPPEPQRFADKPAFDHNIL